MSVCFESIHAHLITEFLQLNDDVFLKAAYEMVVLHPEHFLPKGSDLVFYEPSNTQVTGKRYVVGYDRTLRQFPGTEGCDRLPPFTFDVNRGTGLSLNPFLVVLNAEIKFRRFKRMMSRLNEEQRRRFMLPPEMMELIDETIKLVNLIYWKPIRPTPKLPTRQSVKGIFKGETEDGGVWG